MQVHPHFSQRLSLRLVHGHGKCHSDRELPMTHLERHLGVSGDKVNVRDPSSFSSLRSCNDPDFQKSALHSNQMNPGPIANPMIWIKIAKDHEDETQLEDESVGWEGRDINGLKIFCRVLDALTILISQVITVIDPLLSRKGLQQSGVELIHIHIVRTENGPLQKVLVQVARIQVWIDFRNHLREVMAT